jgi:hypothetical protein
MSTFLSLMACLEPPEPVSGGALERSLEESLIVGFGHGMAFDDAGQEVTLDKDVILYNQEQLLASLPPQTDKKDLIYGYVKDTIVAQALYADVLLEGRTDLEAGRLRALNHGLRWHYLLEILGEKGPQVGETWRRGVPKDAATKLESKGVKVLMSIGSGGKDYQEACKAAGVPVPPSVFGKGWTSHGELSDTFILQGLQAMLWSYTSAEPEGICLALPRYGSSTDPTADFLGVICLGTRSSQACFWDPPRGVQFARDVEVSLSEFLGGADLTAKPDVCSDCHAGENPYIVHPDEPAFADVLAESGNLTMPLSWHEPLVDASWPQNPGPTRALEAIESPGRCDSCHTDGGAGRFPAISQELEGYCDFVLSNAVARTMPQGDAPEPYRAHKDALLAMCEVPSSSGEVVTADDLSDDPDFVSAPVVIEPLYACSSEVAVRGARLGAKVTLYVDGQPYGPVEVRDPDHVVFEVSALEDGDKVEVEQNVEGTLSERGAAIVKSHKVDYPNGLPAPVIDPIVYECASRIRIQHVPGANVTVSTDGGSPVGRSTAHRYAIRQPQGAPFTVGMSFVATDELCGDESPPSAPVAAGKAPEFMPAPTFDPPEIFEGQELVTLATLVRGATTELSDGTSAWSTDSWPAVRYTHFDLGGPLRDGASLSAEQELCKPSPPVQSPKTLECDELSAPRLEPPRAGQDLVVVAEAVPGATIRIYDAADIEVGDGSGVVVGLSRELISSDVLRAVQQVGACTSAEAYQIEVD